MKNENLIVEKFTKWYPTPIVPEYLTGIQVISYEDGYTKLILNGNREDQVNIFVEFGQFTSLQIHKEINHPINNNTILLPISRTDSNYSFPCYIVENSKWAHSIPNKLFNLTHYLIISGGTYVDILTTNAPKCKTIDDNYEPEFYKHWMD